MTSLRIGHGFDVHRFGSGDGITLGGVWIPHSQGLVAHSDGDVLIHALCDALLGALGRGDIGKHFPDTDPEWESVDSRRLLQIVAGHMHDAGFVLGNADLTVIAQAPRLSGYTESMVENIAVDLSTDKAQINVKATTTEGLGFAGRKEGIAVHAVVLLDGQS